MKVKSTYKILKGIAFNETIDESWIDWALEMMEAGYDSEKLYMLAGMMPPFNQFELHELTRKVLDDLGFSYADKDAVLNNYLYYLIIKAIDNPQTYLKTLQELKSICVELDMPSTLMGFYLLYFAKYDLIDDEVQWYWDGADRQNIDEVIRNYFRDWMTKFEQNSSATN